MKLVEIRMTKAILFLFENELVGLLNRATLHSGKRPSGGGRPLSGHGRWKGENLNAR
jgi:hypothetical protein